MEDKSLWMKARLYSFDRLGVPGAVRASKVFGRYSPKGVLWYQKGSIRGTFWKVPGIAILSTHILRGNQQLEGKARVIQ